MLQPHIWGPIQTLRCHFRRHGGQLQRHHRRDHHRNLISWLPLFGTVQQGCLLDALSWHARCGLGFLYVRFVSFFFPSDYLSFPSGLLKHSYTFFFSAFLAALSSILVLISAAVWTVIIKKSQSVNDIMIGASAANSVSVGINVAVGPGIILIWVAFACLFASVVPYMVR